MMYNNILDYFYKDLNKYEIKSSIIKNYLYFSEDFVPSEIKFREEQKEKIIKNLFLYVKGIRNSHLFLFGNTGTGKTITSKYITLGLNGYISKNKLKMKVVYINCRMINSKEKDYYIYGKIYEELYNERFRTGLRKNDLYEYIKQKINNEGYRIILILDEVDFLFKENSDLLYNFLRNDDIKSINGFYNIFISNTISFLDNIDPRIKSSLSSVIFVEFPPYKYEELKEILIDRAKIALNDGKIDQSLINYIAARVAKESGDARVAINVLKNAAMIAEEKNKDRIEKDDVDEAFDNVDYDIIKSIVLSLNKTQKIILLSLIKKQLEKNDYVTFSEIYNEYVNLSESFGYSPLDNNTIYKNMKALELILGNYLEAQSVSMGRNGYKRIYKIILESEKIEKMIDKIKNSI